MRVCAINEYDTRQVIIGHSLEDLKEQIKLRGYLGSGYKWNFFRLNAI
jgi:hypothetical protein